MEKLKELKEQLEKEREKNETLKEKYDQSSDLLVKLEKQIKNQPDYLDQERKNGFKLFRSIRRIFNRKRKLN